MALSALAALAALAAPLEAAPAPLAARVGYFMGGRTSVVMRLAELGDFESEGLRVTLMTKRLREPGFHALDRAALESDKGHRESKATGVELTRGLLEGRWELATVGESSFIAAAAAGEPVVAVAALGHDVRGQSGHLFALRKGLRPRAPEDYRGLLLLSRRAGPGDRAMLREYLQREGVDLGRDALTLREVPRTPEQRAALPKDKVLLAHEVDDDVMIAAAKRGLADGGFFHLKPFEAASGKLYMVKPLEHWLNADVSQAVLVCTREYRRSPEGAEAIRRFLRAYVKRVRRERALKPWERRSGHSHWARMESSTRGLNYPQYDDVPVVKPYLLAEAADLLHRHGALESSAVPFEEHVDNSLVLDVASALEAPPSWR